MAGALEGDIFIGPKAEVRKPVSLHLSVHLAVLLLRGAVAVAL